MNLFYTIKQKLEQINNDELLKTMGYHNLKVGHRTLQKFLDTADIYLWLKKGNYDLKYSSEEFLIQLLKALDLTSVGKELNYYYRRLDAIRAMRKAPYLFIYTNFKRAQQPIFSLGFMEGRRNIRIDKELLVFKSETGVLKMVGDIIREHYLSSDGKLPLWGKIYNYVYHHTNGEKYIFDRNGTWQQGHTIISESRAEIRIGNQVIL